MRVSAVAMAATETAATAAREDPPVRKPVLLGARVLGAARFSRGCLCARLGLSRARLGFAARTVEGLAIRALLQQRLHLSRRHPAALERDQSARTVALLERQPGVLTPHVAQRTVRRRMSRVRLERHLEGATCLGLHAALARPDPERRPGVGISGRDPGCLLSKSGEGRYPALDALDSGHRDPDAAGPDIEEHARGVPLHDDAAERSSALEDDAVGPSAWRQGDEDERKTPHSVPPRGL